VTLKRRLSALERAIGPAKPPAVESDLDDWSDDDAADRTGEHLWFRDSLLPRLPDSRPPAGADEFKHAMFAWQQASAQARAAGCTEYDPARLRSFAMRLWTIMRPNILAHRRAHGAWVWDDPPAAIDRMTPAQVAALPTGEKMRLHQEALRRRGHWEKSA
jgi:hypothetical protein